MKFLLSGSLFQKRGPRAILLMSLCLLFFGLVLHAIHYHLDIHDRLETYQTEIELNVDPGQYIESEIVLNGNLYENLHTDLFLFSLVYLILASLWLQAPIGRRGRAFWLHLPAIILLVFILMRLLSGLVIHGILIEIFAGAIFYSIYFINIIMIFWKIWQPGISYGKT